MHEAGDNATGRRPTGGRPGKGRVVAGKFGRAQVPQAHATAISGRRQRQPNAGVAEFWVALGFDAATVIKKPGVLRNQLFLTVGEPGGCKVCVYSTLVNTCVGVWDKQRQLVCYGSFPGYWKRDEWHHLELRWGRQLELWCDGRREVTQDWQGLFGPIDVQPEDLRLMFGSYIGYNDVECEYALDEFRILGPGGEQVSDYPTMTIPRIKPPVIDGKLAAGEWDGAAQTTGFVGLNERTLVDTQTIVRAGWDDEALYLCYECLDPQRRPLTARLAQRNASIFFEDAVDVILQPEPDRFPYYHLAASASAPATTPGTIPGARRSTTRGSIRPGPWPLRARRGGGWWSARFPSRNWRAARRPRRASGGGPTSAATAIRSTAIPPGRLRRAVSIAARTSARSSSAAPIAASPGPVGRLGHGQAQPQVELTGLLFSPLVTVRGKVVGASAKPILETENRLADYREVSIKPPTLVSGLYNLTVRATTAQGDMYYQRFPLRVIKPYDIAVEGYPYEGKLWVTANVAGLGGMPAGLVARSRLLQGEKVFGRCETARFQNGLGKASMSLEALRPASTSSSPRRSRRTAKCWRRPRPTSSNLPSPAGGRTTLASITRFPPPGRRSQWATRASPCGGRHYRCAGGTLPQQIVNQREEMLAAPIAPAAGRGRGGRRFGRVAGRERLCFARRGDPAGEDPARPAGRQARGKHRVRWTGALRCDAHARSPLGHQGFRAGDTGQVQIRVVRFAVKRHQRQPGRDGQGRVAFGLPATGVAGQ